MVTAATCRAEVLVLYVVVNFEINVVFLPSNKTNFYSLFRTKMFHLTKAAEMDAEERK